MESLFGHERLDEHPGCVCETTGVDNYESILSFRSIIQRIAEISLGNGQLEIVRTQIAQIPNDHHLINIPSHLGSQINFQVVNIIVRIPLSARQLVHFNATCLTQNHRTTHKVLAYELVGS